VQPGFVKELTFFSILLVSAVVQYLEYKIWWEEDNNWQILTDLCIDVFSLQ